MRGRKPSPPHLRLLRGNPGKRRIAPGLEARLPPSPPAPPDHLSPHARAAWTQVATELYRLGCLSALDGLLLEVFVEAYARWRIAKDALNLMAESDLRTGATLIKSANGDAMPNPLLGAVRKAAELMVRTGSELGLSPAARCRLNASLVPQPAIPSKFGRLLA